MSIASELNNYRNGLDDAYDAVNDMSGIIPQHKNMDNLDQAIRTIPQSTGTTYTAGNGINIDANNEISIDDTVVAELSDLPGVMTGATSSVAGASGLAPAPSAGDQGKFLKGDGTWGTPILTSYSTTEQDTGMTWTNGEKIYRKVFTFDTQENQSYSIDISSSNVGEITNMFTTFKQNQDGSGVTAFAPYANNDFNWIILVQRAKYTNTDTLFYYHGSQIANLRYGTTVLEYTKTGRATYSDMYLQNAYVATGDYQMIFLDNQYYYGFDTTLTSDNTFQFSKRELQTKLTAGSNIQINGTTISATDTTYSNFIGATALVGGSAGLVPAPTNLDYDKYLKGDGTWATVQSGGSGIEFFYADPNDIHDNTYTRYHLYKDSSLTTVATVAEFISAFTTKGVYILAGSQVFSVVFGWDNDSSSWSSSEELFFELHTADVCIEIGNDSSTTDEFYTSEKNYVQHQLTAGTNISIGGNDVISVTGMPVLYGSQGQNTDGAVTQKVFTDTVGDVESILQTLNSGAGV